MTFEREPSPAMRRVRIHQLVGAEFAEVLAWYADLSPLAADHFAASFHAALEKGQRRPTARAPWRPPFRRVRLKRFPYLLVFAADQREISILALVHERREPVRAFVTLARRRAELG